MSVVVVGVHGPAESGDVLALALREARQRGGVVELVTVWQPDDVPDAATLWGAGREARRRALATQRRAIASVADEASDLRITSVIAEGKLCEVLEEASRGAACLVLGPGGPDGRTRRPAFLQTVGCPVIRLQPPIDVPERVRGHGRSSPRPEPCASAHLDQHPRRGRGRRSQTGSRAVRGMQIDGSPVLD
jgi:hypothetical protein